MSTLYRRTVVVEIARPGEPSRRITGLRIRCKARRTSTSAPDEAAVEVFNLSDATLGALEDPGALTRVLAGYGDSPGQIASGTIVPGSLVGQRSPTEPTRWQVHDGGYDLRGATLAHAWAGEVRASEIVDAALAATGWARGTVDLATDVRYATGFVAYDSARAVLDEVCRDCGSRWSVQDGRLQVWPRTGQRRATVEVLSADSGVIGSPRRTEDGVEVVCLLRPGMRPGDAFRLRHDKLGGDYVARDVDFTIDSGFGAEFYTSIRAVPA